MRRRYLGRDCQLNACWLVDVSSGVKALGREAEVRWQGIHCDSMGVELTTYWRTRRTIRLRSALCYDQPRPLVLGWLRFRLWGGEAIAMATGTGTATTTTLLLRELRQMCRSDQIGPSGVPMGTMGRPGPRPGPGGKDRSSLDDTIPVRLMQW